MKKKQDENKRLQEELKLERSDSIGTGVIWTVRNGKIIQKNEVARNEQRFRNSWLLAPELFNMYCKYKCFLQSISVVSTTFPSTSVFKTTTCTALRCLSLSAQSNIGKFNELKFILDDADQSFHIVSITETWLRSDHPDALFDLSHYFIFRNDRQDLQGGGVAPLVHKSVNCLYHPDLSNDQSESLRVDLCVLNSCTKSNWDSISSKFNF